MKKRLVKLLGFACILPFFLMSQAAFAHQESRIELLKKMFDKVTIEKNYQAISLYYDKDFELYSNGQKMTLDAFIKIHQDIYKTAVQYQVRYDEETFVEQGNKIAGRLFITVKKPNEEAREIEVILIAEYKGNKLYRLWELTYPDWSKMKTFQEVTK